MAKKINSFRVKKSRIFLLQSLLALGEGEATGGKFRFLQRLGWEASDAARLAAPPTGSSHPCGPVGILTLAKIGNVENRRRRYKTRN